MPAFFVYLAYSFVSFRNLRWNRSPQKYQPAAHYPHSKAALFARTDRILLCGFHVLSFGEPDGRVAHLTKERLWQGRYYSEGKRRTEERRVGKEGRSPGA